MDEKLKAMQVACKVISVIMKIGYIAMIAVMCVCAASLIFIAATGGETSVVTPGGTNIVVADAELESPESVAAICAALLVAGAFLFVIFLLTHRVFSEISATGAPFNTKYVKTIKRVGVLAAAMGLAGGIVGSVAAAYAGADTSGIFAGAPGVLVGAVIYCLAYIFDYGCALQKQSGEML